MEICAPVDAGAEGLGWWLWGAVVKSNGVVCPWPGGREGVERGHDSGQALCDAGFSRHRNGRRRLGRQGCIRASSEMGEGGP